MQAQLIQEKFQTVHDFLATRSWPTKSSIRYYIFYNICNFETKCVRRVGRKVLINIEAFQLWLEEQAK
ncbi:MAG: hypothetical protein JXA94_00245 [Parachlamydiales bacterium]|nr:hypothetical protein [Parachlamydiales bacterium]